MTVLVILTGSALGFYQAGIPVLITDGALELILALGLGCAALIMGSVLPDIDGKGRIRWTMGPVLGAFGLIPPFMGRFWAEGPTKAAGFIWNEGARLFLVLTMIGFVLVILPFRHRGWMHSITPGIIFGSTFGSYVFMSTSLGIEGAILVGCLGMLGYLWHLSLDGELSL
jgi:hypothetical protein